MKWSLAWFISSRTVCVSLASGKLRTTVEQHSHFSCTGPVIMVEAASWEKESKYVCVSWLQMNLGMNINVYDNMRIITAVLFTSLPKTLRETERFWIMKTWLELMTHFLFLTGLPPSREHKRYTVAFLPRHGHLTSWRIGSVTRNLYNEASLPALSVATHAGAPWETGAHIIKERWLSLHNEHICYEYGIISWLVSWENPLYSLSPLTHWWIPPRTPALHW